MEDTQFENSGPEEFPSRDEQVNEPDKDRLFLPSYDQDKLMNRELVNKGFRLNGHPAKRRLPSGGTWLLAFSY